MKKVYHNSLHVENLYLGHGAALRASTHSAGDRTGTGILCEVFGEGEMKAASQYAQLLPSRDRRQVFTP